jgi:ribosomal-protein-alanine N-acetyltransferase
LNANNLSFNNLDWLSPNERFNEPGCFALIENQHIKALLAATPEYSTAAWLRFFYAERDGESTQYFKLLLSQAVTTLLIMGAQSLFSLVPYDWLERLLKTEGFKLADSIVTLHHNSPGLSTAKLDPELIIREMTYRDLAAVEAIDVAAFDPIWQLNHTSLVKTYHLSAWHSVALLEGQIVGYQMSTSAFDSAHLARLAVDPRWQRRGVGRRLIEDMFETFSTIGVRSFSVNTQASNPQSLSLYHSLGFTREDRDILVMSLDLN